MSSIQKLRKCAQAADNNEWVVAFLDCRRRNAGAVGIILRESSRQGIYIRQHFPSMIETENISLPYNCGALQVETIYVEADSVRMSKAEYTDLSLLHASSIHVSQTAIRATNLDVFGVNRASGRPSDIYFYESSAPKFPHIAFSAEKPGLAALPFNTQYNKDGLTCNLYFQNNLEGYKGYGHNPDRYYGIEITAVASQFVPTDRGATTCITLNDQHRLMVRSQMQWKREQSTFHMDNLKKESLITLSIVPTGEVAE